MEAVRREQRRASTLCSRCDAAAEWFLKVRPHGAYPLRTGREDWATVTPCVVPVPARPSFRPKRGIGDELAALCGGGMVSPHAARAACLR